jgi:glutamate dehydrogenase (NADP+)
MTNKQDFLESVKDILELRYPTMPEFHQAVLETAGDVGNFLCSTEGSNVSESVFLHLMEPDRVVNFRVVWLDDNNRRVSNRGYRVQFSNALGPYKGGLRFSGSLTPSVLHFLGFEQIFKNSLTGLPLGGAKGGADFDPTDRTDGEIERFCRAFMGQLARHIGPDKDVPAGDIGVGTKEIAILFDEYRSLTGIFHGAITGKDPVFGGSLIREEATGYGCIYFAEEMLKRHGDKLAGKRCVVSGAGNVSLHAASKLLELDAQVVSLSDRSGTVEFPDGLSNDELDKVSKHKAGRGSLKELAKDANWKFNAGSKPWAISGDLAFACATQNEIEEQDAESLIAGDCSYLVEGANMPCTSAASARLEEAGVVVAPAKAANAGGVAVSGLEIVQNRTAYAWDGDKVEDELRRIMQTIHADCVAATGEPDAARVNYRFGANVASFKKLARATCMFSHG